MTITLDSVTVVFAHAAWFDATSFAPLIDAVEQRGGRAVAAQLPLTSFSDDVRTLRRLLARQSGPVVLVGHSYGGAVISAAATDNAQVKGLVYVAAIVPDEHETVGEIFMRAPPHPLAPKLAPDGDGLLWLKPEDVRNALAQDMTAGEAARIAATQKPISVTCLGEQLPRVAWHSKPSWFLIAEDDRMVAPETQRFLAERMKSTIKSVKSDHVPLASHRDEVIELISAAAREARAA
jgi:pimeloyl-ACP methyl ester carboxylesterase